MNEIRYRFAKPSDAKEIANVHWHVRDRYTQGFFLSLGKRFLKSFYEITLNDPWEIVVCAINEDDRIVGFISCTLDAKKRYNNIRNHKIKLGLAALGAIIRHPSLLISVLQRYRSLGNNKEKFVNTDGVRVGYWCWLKNDDSLKAVDLNLINGKILRALEINEIFFEVDKFNKAVYNFNIKVTKAEPIEEITLPDGRVRVLMKKKLERKKT